MRALIILILSAIYVVIWFRKDLDDANTLMAVVTGGVIALASFLYTLFSPRVHHRVTKILVGSGALVATFCAGAFIHYTWTEWARLRETRLSGMLLFFCTVSGVAAVIAWIAFWRCKWSRTDQRTVPAPKSTATS
jgi:hypothetical protein